MSVVVKHTAAWWTANNPILGLEVEGIETDTGKQKYGDNETTWNDLPYTGLKREGRHLTVGSFGFDEIALVSGDIDGVNDTFIWADAPLQVYLNGQLLREGHGYTQVGVTTVFDEAPFTGDLVWSYGGNGLLAEATLNSGAINGVNDVFVWDKAPLQLFWNGQLLREGTGYTIVGNTTTLATPPDTGDLVWAFANY